MEIIANVDDFNYMIKFIKNNSKVLKQSSHGKKIYEKLIKNYKQYLVDEDNSENNSTNINNTNNSSVNYSQNSNNEKKNEKIK